MGFKTILFVFSLIIVAFGQPAWIPFFGVLAALFGYALFFKVLLTIENGKQRFWLGTLWFALIQAVQLSWLLTHPFNYIYGLYLFLIFAMGAQFGLFSYLLTKNRLNISGILGLTALWVISEWSRLFFFSGFPFNPIGIALSSTLYGLQNASLFGVYGLSFCVMFVNLLLVKIWQEKLSYRNLLVYGVLAFAPYFYGAYQFHRHQAFLQTEENTLDVLLVQTAFPIEEILPFKDLNESIAFVKEEWVEVLKTLTPYLGKKIDLIALPEYVVPYGTFAPVFQSHDIEKIFVDQFQEKGKNALPPLEEPLAYEMKGKKLVTNAYVCQAISNLFQADLVAGLQDDQWVSENSMKSYSSAFYFWPGKSLPFRYEKQVLLPMAEYIPFESVTEYAKEYGISGSFTCGTGAKVFPGCKVPFGLSICYEEAYGNLMRDNRVKGAELLVNLTSDVWYPNSRLPKQHFDHARLRTVEMGIPLIRSCNTGITSALNSLGEVVESLGDDSEWDRKALFAQVPLYTYKTLYTEYGDAPVVYSSFLFLFFLFCKRKKS